MRPISQNSIGWVTSTFIYQVLNFVTTVILFVSINRSLGSSVVAYVSSAELLSGVLGTIILRLGLSWETSLNAHAAASKLLTLRIFSWLLCSSVILLLPIEAPEKLALSLAISSVCLTPAYELLRTDYLFYGLVLSTARFASIAVINYVQIDALSTIGAYFLPSIIAGLLSGLNGFKLINQSNSSNDSLESNSAITLISITVLGAFVGSHTINAIGSAGGYLVTVERVIRAATSFIFPYFYRLFPSRGWEANFGFFCLTASLAMMLFFRWHKSAGVVTDVFLIAIPSLVMLGGTWLMTRNSKKKIHYAGLLTLLSMTYIILA